MNKVFEVSHLKKQIKKNVIIENLSFYGKTGEVLGFLGPNGAGKTTTIKMMTGLIKRNEGKVKIQDYDLDREFERAIECVGAIVETPYMYEHLSGQENIEIFAKAKQATQEQIQAMLELTGLNEQLKDKVKNYSLGMKQRIGIAIALLKQPPLLILDEPTNGLDPLAIKELRLLLQKLAHENKTCVLVSSHMLWEMEQLCDRVIIIQKGKIIGETEIDELKQTKTSLEDYYISCVMHTDEGSRK